MGYVIESTIGIGELHRLRPLEPVIKKCMQEGYARRGDVPQSEVHGSHRGVHVPHRTYREQLNSFGANFGSLLGCFFLFRRVCV